MTAIKPKEIFRLHLLRKYMDFWINKRVKGKRAMSFAQWAKKKHGFVFGVFGNVDHYVTKIPSRSVNRSSET